MKYLKTYRLYESIVDRKKEDEIINYKYLIKDLWWPIIKEAQDFYKINFDLENDEVDEKKTIYIKRDLRKDQPIKYEFNAELCIAGGDWEKPVMYFKLECKEDYGKKDKNSPKYVWDLERNFKKINHSMSKCYVLIPGKEINRLTNSSKKDWLTAYTDESLVKDGFSHKDFSKITDEDKKKAWKWLEDLLEGYVEERHEMLDAPNGSDEQHMLQNKETAEPSSSPSK